MIAQAKRVPPRRATEPRAASSMVRTGDDRLDRRHASRTRTGASDEADEEAAAAAAADRVAAPSTDASPGR